MVSIYLNKNNNKLHSPTTFPPVVGSGNFSKDIRLYFESIEFPFVNGFDSSLSTFKKLNLLICVIFD